MFFCLLLLVLSIDNAMAKELNVIVNKSASIDKLTAVDIRRIYLAKMTHLPSGDKIIPLDVSQDSDLYANFYKAVVGKGIAQISSYWSRMLFTGKGRPPEQILDRSRLIKSVEDDKKYIGYVEGEVLSENIKIVYSMTLP
jgi:hypothetical protein